MSVTVNYLVTNITTGATASVGSGAVKTLAVKPGDQLTMRVDVYFNGYPLQGEWSGILQRNTTGLWEQWDSFTSYDYYYILGPYTVGSNWAVSTLTRVTGITIPEIASTFTTGQVSLYTQTPTTTVYFTHTGQGTTNPSGVKETDQNQSYTVTATPASGWNFVRWERNGEPLNYGRSWTEYATETEDGVTYNAVFTNVTYTITVSVAGEGWVRRSVGSTVTDGPYNLGDVVKLEALPYAGSVFSGWGGALTGTDSPKYLTMTGSYTVSAAFTKTSSVLIIGKDGTGGGSVTVSPTGTPKVTGIEYPVGTVVTLTATPINGSTFTKWAGTNNNAVNPTTVTMDGDRTVTATFSSSTPPQNWTLTVTRNPPEGGTVSVPATSTWPTYPVTNVGITATPAEGYRFKNWTGSIASNQNPISVTMNANKTLVANFEPKTTPPIDPKLIIGGIIIAGGAIYLLLRK